MSRKCRRFDREFKVAAERLVTERSHSLSQVAKDLDMRSRNLVFSAVC